MKTRFGKGLLCLSGLLVLLFLQGVGVGSVAAKSNATCDLTWNEVAGLPAGSDPVEFSDVSSSASGIIWAIGKGGYPGYKGIPPHYSGVLIQFDGKAWIELPLPTQDPFWSLVAGSAANNVWALFATPGYPGKLWHWDGVHWVMASPTPAGTYTAMIAQAAGSVWLVGSKRNGSPTTLRWDGKAWTQLPAAHRRNGVVTGMVQLNRKDAWAVGNFSNRQDHYAFLSRWDGSRWQEFAVDLPEAHLYGIAAAAPDNLWAVGDRSDGSVTTPLVLHWKGKGWKEIRQLALPAYAGISLRTVTALAPNNVWAAGSVTENEIKKGIVLHWDGHTWTKLVPYGVGEVEQISGRGPNGVSIADSQNILTLDGDTFAPESLPRIGAGQLELSGVGASSPEDVWVVGGAVGYGETEAFAEHWDGQAWRIFPTFDETTDSFLEDVAVVNRDDAWAVGHYADASGEHGLVLHWDGAAWTRMQGPDSSQVTTYSNVKARAENDIWIAGVTDQLALVIGHWNGSDWSTLATPIHAYYSSDYRLSVLDTDDIWVAIDGLWHWNGAKWENVLPDGRFKAVLALKADDIWGGGYAFVHWQAGTAVEFRDSTNSEFADIGGVAPDDLYAVGDWAVGDDEYHQAGTVYHWDGSTWYEVLRAQWSLKHAAVVEPNNVWTVGWGKFSYSETKSVIYHGTLPCTNSSKTP